MLRHVALALLAGAISAATASDHITLPVQNSVPEVTVLNGSYYGLRNARYNQDQFLGMPYAQPPLGDLRFNNPQPLNTTWSGYRNATEYSYICYGSGSDTWILGNPVSEDCLTINVVRPSGYGPGDALPVGVWIHGGGSVTGSSLDPRYNLSFITAAAAAVDQPIITVSLNYRLQAFGLLWGSEVADAGVANVQYKDQRLALQWIQENIAAFGGDPSAVTIWGESAGAGSVAIHQLAYGGRNDGLFRGAIQQSGSYAGRNYINASAWDRYYNNITAATGCSNATSTLACLRQVPIDDLNAVLNSSVTAGASWSVQIDGDFITRSGTEQILAGDFVRVPLLHGTNAAEGTNSATKGINTTEQFLADVQSPSINSSVAQTIAVLYPDIPAIGIPTTQTGRIPPSEASLGAQWKRVSAYASDFRQNAPRRLASQVHAQYDVPSWTYVWDVLTNDVSVYEGASHFQEVAFVFYNIYGQGYINEIADNPFANKPISYVQLSYLMAHYWIAFIADLDPNSSNVTDIYWPSYNTTILDDDTPYNLVFDTNDTALAYAAPDLYRVTEIQYIQDRLSSVFVR